jgi:hypothetical protein
MAREGIMDQGLAAVLGALVGAVATGGGAYLTAISTNRLHKRQARRDAYGNFLRDLLPMGLELSSFRNLLDVYADVAYESTPSSSINSQLDKILELKESANRNIVSVVLEGPHSLALNAQLALIHAIKLTAVLGDQWNAKIRGESWDGNPDQVHELQEKLQQSTAQVSAAARMHV